MMESSCVPPGFRFHPRDEELVGYYLRKKVASEKIDLDVIREIDLYRIEPWDLQEKCRIGYEEQNDWYFFSYKDKKYPTGTRTNRATMAGFWKATGRDKAVYDKSKLIGMRKTLVFYKGRAPNGQKTDWIMHEYRLESDDNGTPQEEGWVVCRAFKKRSNGQTNKSSIQGGQSSCFYDQADNVSLVSNPTDYIPRHPHRSLLLPQNDNLMCKQEIIQNDNMNFVNYDAFIQLPELESPSLPLLNMQGSTSFIAQDKKEENCPSIKNVTTDWRDLDKFVACLLSQEDSRYKSDVASCSFLGENGDDNFDSTLLSLYDGEDEESKLSFYLNSSLDCDIGFCVYEK